MNEKTIETLFTYHTTTVESIKQLEELRSIAKDLGKLMIKYGKRQGDMQTAIQKLRESVYFATASIVVPQDEF